MKSVDAKSTKDFVPAVVQQLKERNKMDDDERTWVLRSKDGDHDAFESLIVLHQRMIHALTFRMTGSTADAEDVAQETFVRAFEQLHQFRGDASFSSWLYRIAVNTCLNWRKRELRRRQLQEHWEPPAQHDALNESMVRQVQDALMKLPAKQRAAIVLTVYDGLNHAEAARILDCSETTVSWRVFAARRKLKRLLAWQRKDL